MEWFLWRDRQLFVLQQLLRQMALLRSPLYTFLYWGTMNLRHEVHFLGGSL